MDGQTAGHQHALQIPIVNLFQGGNGEADARNGGHRTGLPLDSRRPSTPSTRTLEAGTDSLSDGNELYGVSPEAFARAQRSDSAIARHERVNTIRRSVSAISQTIRPTIEQCTEYTAHQPPAPQSSLKRPSTADKGLAKQQRRSRIGETRGTVAGPAHRPRVSSKRPQISGKHSLSSHTHSQASGKRPAQGRRSAPSEELSIRLDKAFMSAHETAWVRRLQAEMRRRQSGQI